MGNHVQMNYKVITGFLLDVSAIDAVCPRVWNNYCKQLSVQYDVEAALESSGNQSALMIQCCSIQRAGSTTNKKTDLCFQK